MRIWYSYVYLCVYYRLSPTFLDESKLSMGRCRDKAGRERQMLP